MQVRDSRMEYCVFEEMDLTACSFVDSIVKECSFFDCNMEGMELWASDFDQSIFERNNLQNSNFHQSRNYTLNPFNNEIRGARFSAPEALSLLEFLGVEVEGW